MDTVKLKSQSTYDELITLLLETIASQSYLETYNIPIHEPLFDETLVNFIKKYKSGDAKPGMYPIANYTIDDVENELGKKLTNKERKEFLEKIHESIHFYSISTKQPTKGMPVNGYADTDLLGQHIDNAIGLGVQEDNTHGLCQTFALINYVDPRVFESMTVGAFINNAYIGLLWLKEFTGTHDFQFKLTNMETTTFNELKLVIKRKHILLSEIAAIVSNVHNIDLFRNWFDD